MIKVEVEVEEEEEAASAILTAGCFFLRQSPYIGNRHNNVTEIQFNK